MFLFALIISALHIETASCEANMSPISLPLRTNNALQIKEILPTYMLLSSRLRGGVQSQPALANNTIDMHIYSFRAWDWITGPGPRAHENFTFTLFRNRITKVAVEFVHDDHVTCTGFFRFLSSDIFQFEPESSLFANFSRDCPGYACFVNGHYTGDFLKATNLYEHLEAGNDATGIEMKSGDVFRFYVWNALIGKKTIIFSRADCASRLILTDDGFVFEGAKDQNNYVRNPPTGLILYNSEPPRKLELEAAQRMIEEELQD